MIVTWKSALSALAVAASLQFASPASGAEPDDAPLPVAAEHHGAPRCGGWLAGAGFYLLRPHFSDNTAFTLFATTPAGGGFVAAGNRGRDFAWDYEPAFSTWLGWAGDNGLGVRGRFFHFDHSSRPLSAALSPAAAGAGSTIAVPAFGLPGEDQGVSSFGSPGALLQDVPPLGFDLLRFSSSLEIDAIDLEALYQLGSGPWWFVFSGGGRYLSIEQSYGAALSNPGSGGASETQALQLDRDFQGGGPTAAVHASRRIGQSNLALYGAARGSVVIGTANDDARFTQRILDPAGVTTVGAQATVTVANDSRRLAIPIAELELGLEYGVQMGRARGLVRLGAVSQTYFDAGSASQAEENLSLFGMQLSVGVGY